MYKEKEYTIYVVSLCIQTAAKQRWFRIKYTYSNGVSNFNFLRARNLMSTNVFYQLQELSNNSKNMNLISMFAESRTARGMDGTLPH